MLGYLYNRDRGKKSEQLQRYKDRYKGKRQKIQETDAERQVHTQMQTETEGRNRCRETGAGTKNRYMDKKTRTEIIIGIDIVSLSNCIGNRVIGAKDTEKKQRQRQINEVAETKQG